MRVQGINKVIGRDITVKDTLEIVEKDRPYYRRSGGGLTLSGGECLLQPEFALALLSGAKQVGINTAIESMGGIQYEVIESILPHLDYFLMDIKHTNAEKHREFTGKTNELMLENAKKIAASGQTNLIIRVPVIPTFNNSRDEICTIAEFAAALPGVKRMHLLPYHRLGQDKYEGLGREYTMDHIIPPTNEEMVLLKEAAQKASGLDCQIGG
jgi:pyruvate formate lyase activating enzyme